MGVQERVGVAQDLQVDPAESRVQPGAGWEPDDLVGLPVWRLYPRDSWSAPEHALGPRHDPLREAIGAELDRLAGDGSPR
ncbi:hypothetical protein [Streptomyces nigra]|uniref:hypothetical protein n=1 Tax=Streptomyces nigra TaxID=1827580 RepID=UPI0035D9F795